MSSAFRSPSGHIVKTRILLSRLVPPELVDLILDQAQFWRSVRTETCFERDDRRPLCVEMFADSVSDGRRCVVLTEEIRAWVPVGISRVRRVVFEMTSRDQGWSPDYPLLKSGPYRDSQTWFEAMIIRDFHPSNLNDTTHPLTAPSEKLRTLIIQELEQPPKSRSPELITVKHPRGLHGPDDSDTWMVQYNRYANPEPKEHVVVWTLGETGFEDCLSLEMVGSGKGAWFFERLREGDRIALVACVSGQLDQNIVRLAAVELFYAT